jgi:hypothetical protein
MYPRCRRREGKETEAEVVEVEEEDEEDEDEDDDVMGIDLVVCKSSIKLMFHDGKERSHRIRGE